MNFQSFCLQSEKNFQFPSVLLIKQPKTKNPQKNLKSNTKSKPMNVFCSRLSQLKKNLTSRQLACLMGGRLLGLVGLLFLKEI